MPLLLAPRLAGRAMPLRSARLRLVASVLPFRALNLAPRAYYSGFQVDVRPAQSERFSLADTEASATDQRAPFLLAAATARSRRASSRVSASTSCAAAAEASNQSDVSADASTADGDAQCS
jgi:hypothetical protein